MGESPSSKDGRPLALPTCPLSAYEVLHQCLEKVSVQEMVIESLNKSRAELSVVSVLSAQGANLRIPL